MLTYPHRRLRLAALPLVALAIAGEAQENDWAAVRARTADRLAEIARSVDGVFGLVAIDLTSGERFAINDSIVFPQASAIKVPILVETFRQARAGTLSLDELHAVRPEERTGGSGIIQMLPGPGTQLTIRDLCTLMIVESDNTATNILIDRVGMKNINATLASAGYRRTVVQRKMMDTKASARGDENLSTPDDAARLMAAIHRGEILDRPACDEMLAMLSIPKSGSLRPGVPDSVRIAFKPGGIPGVLTEWAVVNLPERPYAVAVMEKYAVGSEADAAARQVSEVLFSYFWRRGRTTRWGTYTDPGMWTR